VGSGVPADASMGFKRLAVRILAPRRCTCPSHRVASCCHVLVLPAVRVVWPTETSGGGHHRTTANLRHYPAQPTDAGDAAPSRPAHIRHIRGIRGQAVERRIRRVLLTQGR
jgi:hypothetical protein